MSTLQTQYQNYLKENPESLFTFEEWSDWKFSNMELPPPHNGLRPLNEHAEELSDWDVTLMDGLGNEPYISDDFQIGPDGAYEHNEDITPRSLMNEEQQELIAEAYENYTNYPLATIQDHHTNILYQNRDKGWCVLNGRSMASPHPTRHLTQEEFINKIKTDEEFSQKWGLQIEERELDMMERWKIADLTPNMEEFDFANYMCDKHNVPTKLITITHNDKTIESYE